MFGAKPSIPSSARSAVPLSKATATKTAHTALVLVMQKLGERMVAKMADADFKPILLYQSTMAVFENMKNNRLISEEEFTIIETMFAKKYGLDLSVIYRQ